MVSDQSFPQSHFWFDFGERVLWTVIEAVCAVGITYFGDLGFEWVPVLTAALSAVKGLAARKIGNPDSAAVSKSR